MALTKIKADGLTADLIDETKLADDSIDSEHYNDGSIDNAHLADDAVGVAELSATGTASSSTFLRGDNSWAAVTSTTINNNADNRVITGSGTANTLEGEANLTFDGTSLLTVHVPSATGEPALNFTNSDTGTGTGNGFGLGINGSESPYIWNRENTDLRIATNNTERLRINSAGTVIMGATSYGGGGDVPALYVSSTSGRQVKIHNTNANTTSLQLSNASTGEGDDAGMMFAALGNSGDGWINNAENAAIRFGTNGTERMRILAGGGLTFNGDTAAANALDDFEEGNYSPTLAGATSTTSANFYGSEAKLSYHKIGKLVVIHGRVRIENNNFSGQGKISLPFAAGSHDSTDNAGCSAVATHGANFENDGVGTGHNMGLFIETGGSQSWAYFLINRDDSNWISATSSHLTAGSYLAFNLSYRST